MLVHRKWLPREGFNADLLLEFICRTALNPGLTLPLYLLLGYTSRGKNLVVDHETAFKRLKILFYLGLARYLNGILSRGALNNWKGDAYDWTKEVVVVTGGSEGIGKHLVRLLASRNIKVAVLDIQPLTYETPNSNVRFFHCDVTSFASIATSATEIRNTLGFPTVLVNNAGIVYAEPILTASESSIRKTFAVNTFAHYALVKEFLPHMISRNHGMVVTVASMASVITPPQIVPYCGSKAAAVSFHEGLSMELKHRYGAPKVRTVLVNPSWADTKLSSGFVNESNFLSKTLSAETVAEGIFDAILSGKSSRLILPRVLEAFTGVRGFPAWLALGITDGTKDGTKGMNKGKMQEEKRGDHGDEGLVRHEKEGNIVKEEF
ncbi:hypothetical protein MMC09_003984 [Bachmanniomyces sp. S44760]|nr:hypothetical protein [Bachmanniomyces sp. S44760]